MLLHDCNDELTCFKSTPSNAFKQFIQKEHFTRVTFARASLSVIAKYHPSTAAIFRGKISIKITESSEWNVETTEYTPKWSTTLIIQRHLGRVTRKDEELNETQFKDEMHSAHDKVYFLVQFGYTVNGTNGHANALFFNLKTKTAEHFEPNGGILDTPEEMILIKFLNEFAFRLGYNYIPPAKTCPRFGPQFEIGNQPTSNGISPRTNLAYKLYYGTCSIWSLWSMHLRLQFPDIPTKKLLYDAIATMVQITRFSIGDFIEEFIWELYQDIVIEHEQTIPLHDFMYFHCNSHLTAENIPLNIALIFKPWPQWKFANVHLAQFMEANPKILQGMFKNHTFKKDWIRCCTKPPGNLTYYSVVSYLPDYANWKTDFDYFLRAQCQIANADYMERFLEGNNIPVMPDRAIQIKVATASAFKKYEVFDDQVFSNFVKSESGAIVNLKLRNDVEFLNALALTDKSDDTVSVPGFETIYKLPGVVEWGPAFQRFATEQYEIEYGAKREALKNKIESAQEDLIYLTNRYRSERYERISNAAKNFAIPMICLCTDDGRNLQSCRIDESKLAPPLVPTDAERTAADEQGKILYSDAFDIIVPYVTRYEPNVDCDGTPEKK